MKRKFIAVTLLLLLVCFAASGCFDMGGGMFGQSSPTTPPQKEYKSIEELTAAVASAKADTSAADVENLKGLTYYYGLKALPDGAKVSSVKVSDQAVIVAYTFGQTSKDSYDNQMQIVWYRKTDASQYLGQVASSYTNYKSISSGDISYLYINPDVQLVVTPSPGADPAAPTPTPLTTKYCQFAYWVQDNAAFMAAVPLGFTEADISKYCVGAKVNLQ